MLAVTPRVAPRVSLVALLWVTRQKEAHERRGELTIILVVTIWLYPGPVSNQHVDDGLARPVLIVRENEGPTHLPAVDFDGRMSVMAGVRQCVEVEDVGTGDGGCEVPGGGVESTTLVVQHSVKLQVGGSTQVLILC